MIEILKSLTLGGIQGVSEFLPISSSAHLVIFPYIMKWNYQGLSFDIALHFGTAIAIITYFWKDWTSLIASAIKNLQKKKNVILSETKNPRDPSAKPQAVRGSEEPSGSRRDDDSVAGQLPSNFLWQILLASIPAAIIGFLLSDYIEKYFHSPLLIASNLIFFGVILWLVDKYSKAIYKLQFTSYKQSLLIGLSQCVALIPGVSRSGITITTARSLGFNKKDGAKVSFLLGTPAMLGAFLLSAKDLSSSDINMPFLIATISAAFFGFLAIKYLLKYLERGSFAIFVWYRIIIGLIVMGIYFLSK